MMRSLLLISLLFISSPVSSQQYLWWSKIIAPVCCGNYLWVVLKFKVD